MDKNNREVSEQGKSDLDSLLSYIIHHPKSKIAIIGLFDTQGIYETNVTSAIFSAKVVGNYLKTNGFNDDRIILFWDFKNNINSKGESPSKDGFSESPKVEVLVLND